MPDNLSGELREEFGGSLKCGLKLDLNANLIKQFQMNLRRFKIISMEFFSTGN